MHRRQKGRYVNPTRNAVCVCMSVRTYVHVCNMDMCAVIRTLVCQVCVYTILRIHVLVCIFMLVTVCFYAYIYGILYTVCNALNSHSATVSMYLHVAHTYLYCVCAGVYLYVYCIFTCVLVCIFMCAVYSHVCWCVSLCVLCIHTYVCCSLYLYLPRSVFTHTQMTCCTQYLILHIPYSPATADIPGFLSLHLAVSS